jgi:hypothetical protein
MFLWTVFAYVSARVRVEVFFTLLTDRAFPSAELLGWFEHKPFWQRGQSACSGGCLGPKRLGKPEEKLKISSGRSLRWPSSASVESRRSRSVIRAPLPAAMPMQRRRMTVREPRNCVSWKGPAGFRITGRTAASTPRDASRSAPSRC